MSAEPPSDANPNQPSAESLVQEDRPKTPSNTKPPHRVNEDTPYKHSSTHNHEYLNGDLSRQREAVIEDLSYSVLQLKVDFFLDFILPPLKNDFNVDNITFTLQGNGLIGPDGKALTDFATKPKDSRLNEDKIFEPLSKLFEEVVNAAKGQGPNLEQTMTMRLLPNEAPVSTKPSIRPDGYFLLKDADDRADQARRDIEAQKADQTKEAKKDDGAGTSRYWYDIAVIQEFKKRKNNKSYNDDVSKLVYGMQVMMSLDPSRRFAFGITIEDTEMRLWFCSRGLVAASEPFDFTTSAEKLVKIYLKLAFASKDELGWDPTMKIYNLANDIPTCHIQVGENIYETVEVLSSFAAETIVGRGTRVYKVRDLKTGKHYVLKDVWVEDGRALEHEIREKILEAVKENFGEDVQKKAARHLLTPVAHWLVPVGEETDHTVDVMMRGEDPPLDSIFELVIEKKENDDRSKGIGWSAASDNEVGRKMKHHLGTPLPRGEDKERRKPYRRRHYRIVFEEVAEPVFVLTRLSDVFIVLKDIAKVLYWIHSCGYVHRDISVGNLYLFEGRGLLGDLEYAKLKSSDSQHELRTGTLDFMAVEAIARNYLDLPTDASKLITLFKQTGNTGSKDPAPTHFPFFHNDLHDMESVWWVAIYMTVFHRDKSQPEPDDKMAERARSASKLFPRRLMINDRITFLRVRGDFNGTLSWLHSSFSKIREALDILREVLHERYKAFEATLPEYSFEAIQGVHEMFQEFLGYCVDYANGTEIEPCKSTGWRHRKLDTRDANQSMHESDVPMDCVPPAGPQQPTKPSPVTDTPSPEPKRKTLDSASGPPGSSSSSVLGKRKAVDDDYMPRPHVRMWKSQVMAVQVQI